MKIIAFLEILTCLTCTTFFGAALYIHLVEHPARIACSPSVALAEWVPSYKRAALMQGFLATVSFLLAILIAYLLSDIRWVWGGITIGSVVPYTFMFVFPINKRLLDPTLNDMPHQIIFYLKKWNHYHGVRTFLSFIAGVIFLYLLREG